MQTSRVVVSALVALGTTLTGAAHRSIDRLGDVVRGTNSATVAVVVQLDTPLARVRGGRVVEATAGPAAPGRLRPARSSQHTVALDAALASLQGSARPLFAETESVLDTQHVRAQTFWGHDVANKNTFVVVEVPASRATEAAALLGSLDGVADAYLQPEAPPTPSPDLRDRQWYRANADEFGLGINSVAEIPGARGGEVRVADVEYAWNRSHEDLLTAAKPTALVAVGTPVDPFSSVEHGSATLGTLIGTDDDKGVTGIVPEADLVLVNANSTDGYHLAASISAAQSVLSRGDVLLIEQQTWGPVIPSAYVPVEWDPAVYTAIKTAVAAGIHVVEPAANGAADLDDASAFGSPFPRGNADSGAIIVGAGSACYGSRNRLSFSSFGSRVNVQGWGSCVTSAGYGDLQDRSNATYTARFGGTSSASATIAGAVAVVSSVAQTQGVDLSPIELRSLLVRTGRAADPNARIGPLPDVASALRAFTPTARITAADGARSEPLRSGALATLSGASSSDPQGQTLTYAWDLDSDGSYDDASAPTVDVRVLNRPLAVRLRVVDSAGAPGYASMTLTPTAERTGSAAAAPAAEPAATPSRGSASQSAVPESSPTRRTAAP